MASARRGSVRTAQRIERQAPRLQSELDAASQAFIANPTREGFAAIQDAQQKMTSEERGFIGGSQLSAQAAQLGKQLGFDAPTGLAGLLGAGGPLDLAKEIGTKAPVLAAALTFGAANQMGLLGGLGSGAGGAGTGGLSSVTAGGFNPALITGGSVGAGTGATGFGGLGAIPTVGQAVGSIAPAAGTLSGAGGALGGAASISNLPTSSSGPNLPKKGGGSGLGGAIGAGIGAALAPGAANLMEPARIGATGIEQDILAVTDPLLQREIDQQSQQAAALAGQTGGQTSGEIFRAQTQQKLGQEAIAKNALQAKLAALLEQRQQQSAENAFANAVNLARTGQVSGERTALSDLLGGGVTGAALGGGTDFLGDLAQQGIGSAFGNIFA